MRAPDHKVQVQKSTRVLISVLNKPHLWKACHLGTRPVSRFDTKPPNPQKFHALDGMFWGLWMGRRDVGMVNPKDLGIPICVSIATDLRRPEHDVRVSVRVNDIVITADVICCIVYQKLPCRKDSIVDDSNCVSLLICKGTGVITIKALAKEPAEKMNTEFTDKILEAG